MVRLKNRYIVLEVQTKDDKQNYSEIENIEPLKLQQHSLQQSLQNKVQQLHGDFGVAAIRAGFQAKYTNEYTKIAIIRCRHGPHRLVTSVLPFVTSIEANKVSLNILYIGATIKKCFQFVKMYQERKYDEFCATLDSDEDRKAVREALLNFETTLNVLQN